MDKAWAITFVAEALRFKAAAILATGGFPCEGLFRARGPARENLKNKDSILFWQLKRIKDLLQEVAGATIPVKHIIENVTMDEEPENIISDELGGRPT